MTSVVLTVDTEDPLFACWRWRGDSQRLAVLAPVLQLALEIPERPCSLGDGERYNCRPQTCYPCLVFDLKEALTRSVT